MSPVIHTPDTQSSDTQTTDTQGSDSTQPAIAAVGDGSSASFSESEAAQAYFFITAEMIDLSQEEVMGWIRFVHSTASDECAGAPCRRLLGWTPLRCGW
jgi:hypothetical protein